MKTLRQSICVFTLLATTACAEEAGNALGLGGEGKGGELVVRAHGGKEAREGIASSAFVDGFAVRFTHFVLETSEGENASVASDPVLVELVPEPALLYRFPAVATGRWDRVSFKSRAAVAGIRQAAPIEERIVTTMVERAYSTYMEGELSSPAGQVYSFALGFPVDVDYMRCTSGDGTSGVVIPRNGSVETELTWHLTHAFFDSFAENSSLRAEAWAAAGSGSVIDGAALATQNLASLRGLDGNLLDDTQGVPVIYIPPGGANTSTLLDFVLHARFGHFNGLEGFCQTDIRIRP